MSERGSQREMAHRERGEEKKRKGGERETTPDLPLTWADEMTVLHTRALNRTMERNTHHRFVISSLCGGREGEGGLRRTAGPELGECASRRAKGGTMRWMKEKEIKKHSDQSYIAQPTENKRFTRSIGERSPGEGADGTVSTLRGLPPGVARVASTRGGAFGVSLFFSLKPSVVGGDGCRRWPACPPSGPPALYDFVVHPADGDLCAVVLSPTAPPPLPPHPPLPAPPSSLPPSLPVSVAASFLPPLALRSAPISNIHVTERWTQPPLAMTTTPWHDENRRRQRKGRGDKESAKRPPAPGCAAAFDRSFFFPTVSRYPPARTHLHTPPDPQVARCALSLPPPSLSLFYLPPLPLPAPPVPTLATPFGRQATLFDRPQSRHACPHTALRVVGLSPPSLLLSARLILPLHIPVHHSPPPPLIPTFFNENSHKKMSAAVPTTGGYYMRSATRNVPPGGASRSRPPGSRFRLRTWAAIRRSRTLFRPLPLAPHPSPLRARCRRSSRSARPGDRLRHSTFRRRRAGSGGQPARDPGHDSRRRCHRAGESVATIARRTVFDVLPANSPEWPPVRQAVPPMMFELSVNRVPYTYVALEGSSRTLSDFLRDAEEATSPDREVTIEVSCPGEEPGLATAVASASDPSSSWRRSRASARRQARNPLSLTAKARATSMPAGAGGAPFDSRAAGTAFEDAFFLLAGYGITWTQELDLPQLYCLLDVSRDAGLMLSPRPWLERAGSLVDDPVTLYGLLNVVGVDLGYLLALDYESADDEGRKAMTRDDVAAILSPAMTRSLESDVARPRPRRSVPAASVTEGAGTRTAVSGVTGPGRAGSGREYSRTRRSPSSPWDIRDRNARALAITLTAISFAHPAKRSAGGAAATVLPEMLGCPLPRFNAAATAAPGPWRSGEEEEEEGLEGGREAEAEELGREAAVREQVRREYPGQGAGAGYGRGGRLDEGKGAAGYDEDDDPGWNDLLLQTLGMAYAREREWLGPPPLVGGYFVAIADGILELAAEERSWRREAGEDPAIIPWDAIPGVLTSSPRNAAVASTFLDRLRAFESDASGAAVSRLDSAVENCLNASFGSRALRPMRQSEGATRRGAARLLRGGCFAGDRPSHHTVPYTWRVRPARPSWSGRSGRGGTGSSSAWIHQEMVMSGGTTCIAPAGWPFGAFDTSSADLRDGTGHRSHEGRRRERSVSARRVGSEMRWGRMSGERGNEGAERERGGGKDRALHRRDEIANL